MFRNKKRNIRVNVIRGITVKFLTNILLLAFILSAESEIAGVLGMYLNIKILEILS